MKKSIKLLAAVLAVATVGAVAAFAGCGESVEAMDPVKYTFEAEYAVFNDADDATQYMSVETDYVDGYDTSGEGNVGYFSDEGSAITFVITSDRAVSDAKIEIIAATADMNWTTWVLNDYEGADHEDLLQVNGKSVAVTGTLDGNSMWNYHDWGTLTGTADLVKGENTIEIVCDGTGINVDCIYVTAGAVLTWTETDNS